jgi:multiple sugar transport system substrate-binding protein
MPTLNPTLTRRSLLGGLAALGLVAALPGCAPGGSQPAADEPLRFTFWGPDFYQQFTRQMVDGFTGAHPDIPVSLEPAEWSGYWDRLATQAAANDEPDVINMDGKYLAEYAGRGMLADLEQLQGLDLSGIAASDLDAGRVDGKLSAVSTGQNAWVVLANPDLFAKAGVDVPDDKTWTWDDFTQLATKISDSKAATGFSGGGSYADLTIFLRQRGEDLWADNAMGCSPESLTAWYQFYLDLQKTGATQSAQAAVEDGSANLEQQAFPTAKSAMSWAWTNQLASIREAAGNEKITMLRPPSGDGTVANNGLFGKATMFWSISARSAQQDNAASLVDYLLNDPAANKIQLVNRGVPSNPAAIEAMGDGLTETDQEVVAFMKEVLTEITTTPAVQPMGTSDSQNSFTRYLTEVRFERMTPAEAADATIKEVNGMVQT